MRKLFSALVIFASFAFAQVDINSANETQLATVKGIGSKKAKEIIGYRKNKCFDNIQELEKVKGFGEKSIQKIKKEITVKPCKKVENIKK